MTEQYYSFDDIRKSFIDNGEGDESLTTNTVRDIAAESETFCKIMSKDEKKTLMMTTELINNINWRGDLYEVNFDFLRAAASDLQNILELKTNPIHDISNPVDGFWNTSTKPTELNIALNTYHSRFLATTHEKFPRYKRIHKLAGTASHWTARVNGAKWSEAVHASRWAQAYMNSTFANCEPKTLTSNPHDIIMDLYSEMHGRKGNYGKN